MGDILVYSGRSSSMLGAVHILGANIKANSIADIMTANFDVIIPSCHSVWLDIFSPGVATSQVNFIGSLSNLIKTCRRYQTPLCWIRNFSQRDQALLNKINEACSLRWSIVCSCQLGDRGTRDLHLKKQICHFNMPGTLPANQCTVRSRGHLTASNKKMFWSG